MGPLAERVAVVPRVTTRMARNPHVIEPAGLYQIVFRTNATKFAVFLVLLFFLAHPVVPVFASELAEADGAAPSESSDATPDPQPAPEPDSASDTIAAEAPVSEQTDQVAEPHDAVPEAESGLENEEDGVLDTTGVSLAPETEAQVIDSASTAPVSESSTADGTVPFSEEAVRTTSPAPDTSATTTTVEVANSSGEAAPAVESEIATGTVAAADDIGSAESEAEAVTSPTEPDSAQTQDVAIVTIADTGSSDQVTTKSVTESTDDVPDDVNTAIPEPTYLELKQTAQVDDSHYAFLKNQCVSMGDGAYHCFDASYVPSAADTQVLTVQTDRDGDKEIFMTVDGETAQITHNLLDDDAPYYDPLSDTVVWQRQEAGIYAIYAYDGATETRLSPAGENSMEPHRSGAYTVWQVWRNNAWQIALYTDGETLRLLPSRGGQSIAPQIEGDYVIWNEVNGGNHAVAVYDIATADISYIEDSEGARVTNPRFVLVYDTRFDNGDVITQGFDTETGEVIPLAAAAPAAPKELPSPTKTAGEAAALLTTSKTTSRDESVDLGDEGVTPVPQASSTPGVATTSVATASTSADTVADVPLVVASSTPAATTTLPLTDFDLIVEPFGASSSTATSTQ